MNTPQPGIFDTILKSIFTLPPRPLQMRRVISAEGDTAAVCCDCSEGVGVFVQGAKIENETRCMDCGEKL